MTENSPEQKASGPRKLKLQAPVHAEVKSDALTRLESRYKSFNLEKKLEGQVEDFRLSYADVCFVARKEGRTCTVALINEKDTLKNVPHLHELHKILVEADEELLVHRHESPKGGRLQGFLTTTLKQPPVISSIIALVLFIGGGIATILPWKNTPTQTPSQPVVAVAPVPGVVDQAASSPQMAHETTRPVAVAPIVAPPEPPAPPAQVEDVDLMAALQTYVTKELSSETGRRGLPKPTIVLTQPLSYTWVNGTANCTVDGQIIAGSTVLVASRPSPGGSNVGDNSQVLIENACLDAVSRMVRRYFTQ